jgi:hypothetical protein
MKRVLMALTLAASCLSMVAPAQASKTYSRGPFIGFRTYENNPSYHPRTDMSRGFYGYGHGKGYGYGPNFYGTGGFYGRENYGPGTGVYYRVPGGSGVYGF